jgi:catechol 2,3-dioxygenase-like lactoylglutathione lyase family enzyme
VFPTPETALTHILVVTDPARSRAWYLDVLGATLYREYGSSVVLGFAGTWLLLVEGGGPTDDKPTVTLAPPDDPDRRDNLFTIRVDDCQATDELLRCRVGRSTSARSSSRTTGSNATTRRLGAGATRTPRHLRRPVAADAVPDGPRSPSRDVGRPRTIP